MELRLREHQEEVIEKLREGFRQGHRTQLLYAPTGFGKCLGKDTPVLMYDGRIKAVQDINPGDLLMGPDSNPRRVLSTVQGVGPLYKVTPTKGDPYIVNDAHILSLKITKGSTKYDCSISDRYKAGKIHNISVLDYIKESKTFKHTAKGWRTGVNFPRKYLPIDPYFIGAWIGDGLSSGPSICTADQEILNEVYRVAEEYNLEVRIDIQKNNQSIIAAISNRRKSDKNELLNKMRELNLIYNKHIPHDYLTGDREQRLELLAGLLDTDGYMFKGCFEFIQKNKLVSEGVAFLARSLGFAAYLSETEKTCHNNGVKGTYWRVSISGETSEIPCRILRKKAKERAINKDVTMVGIKVEPIGVGDYYGFQISGDRLFLLGDFTVTHNTEVAIALMKATTEKYNTAAIVLDRLVLVDQTSDRLMRYKLEHGVFQSGHWKFARHERLQVCSAQTLERRNGFPKVDLLIIDECHISRRQTIEFIKDNPDVKVIGLTATPFTKGLGDVYKNVVTGATTNWLVANKWLTPLKVYIAKEIDMTGAKKIAGEWSEKEATERGMKITGDIVESWITKTHEVFGKPEKTIVFCSGVAHGNHLVEEFARRGYNFVSISYKDNDEYKRAAIEDFSKPDTQIHGLIATDILTRGFDVPDVKIGVSARPFSKSLSSHVQQMGRVMRACADKEFALWLDHSGNYLRFREDWDDVYDRGVNDLDDKAEKAKKELTKKEKEQSKCPVCSHLWPRHADTCPSCGHVRQRKNDVHEVAGVLEELVASKKPKFEDRQKFYSELIWIAEQRNYNRGWASHKYRDKFGVWPRNLIEVPESPSVDTLNWVKSRQIAFIKKKQSLFGRVDR